MSESRPHANRAGSDVDSSLIASARERGPKKTAGQAIASATESVETTARSSLEAGDAQRAATLLLEHYGPELLRFLRVRLRARDRADDVFSELCEDIWRALPGFRWESSARTWLYVLARHAASRWSNVSYRRREQLLTSDSCQLRALADRVRTTTAIYRQTSVKRRIRELRAQLDDDQQTLLVLRIDRMLSWKELAIVMGEAPGDTDEQELARASARVRARFRVAKDRLRNLAVRAGLLREDGSP